MAAYRARLAEFDEILGSDKIDLKRMRRVCFEGCSHEKSIRSKSWKVLLNYLPLNVKEWDQHLQKQRRVYEQFIDEMIIHPGQNSPDSERTDVTQEDHPLSLNPDSQWSQYFKDNDMLIQIDKDCRRLCPDLSFFQSATPYPCKKLVSPEKNFNSLRKRVEHGVLKSENVTKNRHGITLADVRRPRAKSHDYIALEEGQEAHWEVAERILFIYGKLNPGQGYVQGMNEILGPIYYSFAADPDQSCKENAEPDAFWCFTNLMSEIRDNFIKTLDHSECGIDMLMRRHQLMLKEQDTALYLKLDQQEIRPQFYAFRWLTLLLSQEFPLPEVLRLWDSLFADINRFDFLICVSCAMLIMVRDKMFKGDFSYNMKLLQNYPATDINDIIAKAVELNER